MENNDRKNIKIQDKWDVELLFQTNEIWEKEYTQLKNSISLFENEEEKKKIGAETEKFKNFLDSYFGAQRKLFKLGLYAQMKLSENLADAKAQENYALFINLAGLFQSKTAYFSPRIIALSDNIFEKYQQNAELKDYKIALLKIRRYKKHTLSEKEEKLLSLQTEMAETPSATFEMLTNADIDLGFVAHDGKNLPLTQGNFIQFLEDENQELRKKAYFQFYQFFEKHQNTLASLFKGSLTQDVYYANVRHYKNTLDNALFDYDIDPKICENLIFNVHENLPLLHRFYKLKKKLLSKHNQILHHYDVYAPLLKEVDFSFSYSKAVEVIINAVEPLGKSYQNTLKEGLNARWVDRYENKGKRSGAFCIDGYDAPHPYILMSYKEKGLNSPFTLIHEAGHAMHSYYSIKNNPYSCYQYTIFEAEIASTFNEQLLYHYLLEITKEQEKKLFLSSKLLDSMVATLFRQTMFFEFEKQSHKILEDGQALSIQIFRSLYRKLLEKYFGDSVILENCSDLEGLRIPHFYRAYYVYQYATGLASAITLSQKLLFDKNYKADFYLDFLSSGGSRYPKDSLSLAKLDISQNEMYTTSFALFEKNLKFLEDNLL